MLEEIKNCDLQVKDIISTSAIPASEPESINTDSNQKAGFCRLRLRMTFRRALDNQIKGLRHLVALLRIQAHTHRLRLCGSLCIRMTLGLARVASLRGAARRRYPANASLAKGRETALAVEGLIASQPHFYFANARKTAFTLAEVLITLGIIGIVAAMTMPALISNYEKKQTVSQLQKVYAELSQAVQLSEVVNEDKKDWDYSKSSKDFFDIYMTQFVKVSTHNVGDSKNDRNITYYQTSGLPEIDLKSLYNTSSVLTLSSGSQIFISAEDIAANTKRKWIIVDLNGFKKPNKMGRDLFCFNIGQQGVMPCSTDDADYTDYNEISRTKLIQGPSAEQYQCSRSARGVWCGALIMIDGWEIKSDYPW